MRKTLLNLLAAATVLTASSNCLTVKATPTTYQNKIVTLDSMIDHAYCLENQMKYIDNEDDIWDPTAYGSALAYKYVDGFTYLITNQHVVGEQEMKIRQYTLQRQSTNINIVDSQHDDNPEDDISLEVVYESSGLDIAILRTTKKLNVLPQAYFGDSNSLEYAEEVYLAGYPMGMFPAVTNGIVANPGNHLVEGSFKEKNLNIEFPLSVKKILDIDANPGNSGGPFFVKRSNRVYWMGIISSSVLNSKGQRSGLAMGIGSNAVRKIADYAIQNADHLVDQKVGEEK